ncbi:MAG: hypothetical protein KGD65_09085 [Candidatus Lokiarchaeota archaeon]|nr:hypothetical protein [Candidatus Lokiarchaeota archaeon]
MLELKELAEKRENTRLERAKVENDKKLTELVYNNRKLRELKISVLHNLRYREEKEAYLRNLEANKAFYNLIN